MKKRFLLVGWDAADWNFLNPLIDSGEMPALNQMIESGVVGDLGACQPLNPASLWTSMTTGKRPWSHGVSHTFEFDPKLEQPVPVSRTSRRTAAIWEMMAAHGLRSMVFGWPATQGSASELTSIVSDRFAEPTAQPGVKPWPPAPTGTYWPDSLSSQLDPLRLSPEAVGADIISRYVPQWGKIDQKRDQRIGRLRVGLAHDLSHCAGIAALLEQKNWDFAAVRLPALGHIVRQFLPLHPPRREWINPWEFELYQNVLRAHCRLLDQTLAIFRRLAGVDSVIMLVSAHGTRVPDLPPAGFPLRSEDGWKSNYGIIAAAGPGFVQDSLLHGASILDVTPTILNYFGLPIGNDMEGRVLLESQSANPEIQWINSWNDKIAVTNAPDFASPAPGPIAERIRLESLWNLAQSGLESGRFAEASVHLKILFHSFPERTDFSHALFQCQLNLGQLEAAEETLEVFLEGVSPGPLSLLPKAELALARKDHAQARSCIAELRQTNLENPQLLRRFGLLLLRLREWDALAGLAKSALQHEQKDPLIWLGLAVATLRQKKPAEAAEAALHAIQLKYFLPEAHFTLARALVLQGKWAEAREAMNALLKLQPENKLAAGYGRRLAQKRPPAAS